MWRKVKNEYSGYHTYTTRPIIHDSFIIRFQKKKRNIGKALSREWEGNRAESESPFSTYSHVHIRVCPFFFEFFFLPLSSLCIPAFLPLLSLLMAVDPSKCTAHILHQRVAGLSILSHPSLSIVAFIRGPRKVGAEKVLQHHCVGSEVGI
jgi:hypothetical protein